MHADGMCSVMEINKRPHGLDAYHKSQMIRVRRDRKQPPRPHRRTECPGITCGGVLPMRLRWQPLGRLQHYQAWC